MKIETITQSLQQYVPSVGQTFNRFSLATLPEVAHNLNKVALPTLAICLLSSLATADAGPVTYWSCVIGCEAMAPPFIAVCIGACFPLLAAPTP